MNGKAGEDMSGWRDGDRGMKRWRYRWVDGLGTWTPEGNSVGVLAELGVLGRSMGSHSQQESCVKLLESSLTRILCFEDFGSGVLVEQRNLLLCMDPLPSLKVVCTAVVQHMASCRRHGGP